MQDGWCPWESPSMTNVLISSEVTIDDLPLFIFLKSQFLLCTRTNIS